MDAPACQTPGAGGASSGGLSLAGRSNVRGGRSSTDRDASTLAYLDRGGWESGSPFLKQHRGFTRCLRASPEWGLVGRRFVHLASHLPSPWRGPCPARECELCLGFRGGCRRRNRVLVERHPLVTLPARPSGPGLRLGAARLCQRPRSSEWSATQDHARRDFYLRAFFHPGPRLGAAVARSMTCQTPGSRGASGGSLPNGGRAGTPGVGVHQLRMVAPGHSFRCPLNGVWSAVASCT